MVKHCVVHFCSNSNKTGHTMHKFPKDANLKRQWVKFVQVKRADFKEPSVHSVISSGHFSQKVDSSLTTRFSGSKILRSFEKQAPGKVQGLSQNYVLPFKTIRTVFKVN